MSEIYRELALDDVLKHRRALLKFISANEAGLTKSNQRGFYLPTMAWKMFTPQPPEDGLNHKHEVVITWPNGENTESAITWYGKKTRHEYRLTKFGRNFPYLNPERVGDLLILIPTSSKTFNAHLLETEEDANYIQATLGIEISVGGWGMYEHGQELEYIDTGGICVRELFDEYVLSVARMPSGQEITRETWNALNACITDFASKSPDERLCEAVRSEFALFRRLEAKFIDQKIFSGFPNVDSFIRTAATVMNRRSSRAGRSLENHVERILKDSGIPFEMRPKIDGNPDVIIPSRRAYYDSSYPVSKLLVVGIKTSLRDRWRQVTREGSRVPEKHLITLQKKMTPSQIQEIREANVILVVPRSLHGTSVDTSRALLDITTFVEHVKKVLRARPRH